MTGKPDWRPISELPELGIYDHEATRYIVWNGVESGEAYRNSFYSYDDDGNDIIATRWSWSHRSTCSCCHSYMNPQPTHYLLMPEGPEE